MAVGKMLLKLPQLGLVGLDRSCWLVRGEVALSVTVSAAAFRGCQRKGAQKNWLWNYYLLPMIAVFSRFPLLSPETGLLTRCWKQRCVKIWNQKRTNLKSEHVFHKILLLKWCFGHFVFSLEGFGSGILGRYFWVALPLKLAILCSGRLLCP